MTLTEDQEDLITDRVSEFFKTSKDNKFIAWDLETNGFHRTSVLSISAMKCQLQPDKSIKLLPEGLYSRFYYPEDGEAYDMKAISINGLSAEVVDKKRSFDYPLRFSEDIESFRDWCGDIDHCLTYNGIWFDSTFLPAGFFPYHFDPKPWLEDMMKLPPTESMIRAGRGDQFKMPSLKECAHWAEIPFDEASAHGSAYDTYVTTKLFEALAKRSFFRPASLS